MNSMNSIFANAIAKAASASAGDAMLGEASNYMKTITSSTSAMKAITSLIAEQNVLSGDTAANLVKKVIHSDKEGILPMLFTNGGIGIFKDVTKLSGLIKLIQKYPSTTIAIIRYSPFNNTLLKIMTSNEVVEALAQFSNKQLNSDEIRELIEKSFLPAKMSISSRL